MATATRQAGAKFQVGGPLQFDEVTTRFEEVSRYSTSELGFVVQMERHEGQVTGRDAPVVIDRRVTMVFRLEGDTWKVLHRHTDPITTAQPDSLLQNPPDLHTSEEGRTMDEVAAFVDHAHTAPKGRGHRVADGGPEAAEIVVVAPRPRQSLRRRSIGKRLGTHRAALRSLATASHQCGRRSFPQPARSHL